MLDVEFFLNIGTEHVLIKTDLKLFNDLGFDHLSEVRIRKRRNSAEAVYDLKKVYID